MKLYTKTGDDGTTGLFGGQRVEKDSPRVVAFGDVDELNSMLGLVASACHHDELTDILSVLQHRLFELGADLATPADPHKPSAVTRISDTHIQEAERQIDRVCESLEPMRTFILPGGTELASRLHVARCVCRRAERSVLAVSRSENIGSAILVYLNRVSDLLFAMARRANQIEGITDVPWIAGKIPPTHKA